MESEERERKKREDQKAKEEEEALTRALNNSERTAQAPAQETTSAPKETSAERQAKLKEQERLREQQRRRMEAVRSIHFFPFKNGFYISLVRLLLQRFIRKQLFVRILRALEMRKNFCQLTE